MDRQQLMNMIANLRSNIEDADNRGTLIDNISNGINELCDSSDTLATSNAEYIRNNEQLRSANMKLFLQIGSTPETKDDKPNEDEPKKLDFADLFNDKGELK